VSRILVVLATWPWPVRSGDGRRAIAVLDALAAAGHEVVVSCLVDDPGQVDHAAADRPAEPIRFPRRALGRRARARWLLSTDGPPLALLARDPDPARAAMRDRLDALDPDLVWCGRLDTWWALGPVLGDRPVIVDTVDLESRKEQTRLRVPPTSGVARGHRIASRLQGRRTVRAWAALEQRAARRATVAVCSYDEAANVPGGVVVPNIYPTPARRLGRLEVGSPPTVLLAGLLTYPPNADGARWLLDEVLPRLRVQVPEVQVRLVGRIDPELARRHDSPSVHVVGFAPDIDGELAKADVVAVPVRYGGGTRIKVLEAWAHAIPVVGTVVGLEGLGARPNESALVADDPQAFADACARLLTDRALRATVAAGGFSRHAAAFTEQHLGAAVDVAVATAMQRRPVPTTVEDPQAC
jgi:glycosyltransferase involved in cell wall biosynthesis